MTSPVGLYIHVPFCAQKCHYCDFYSIPPDEDTLELYGKALKAAAKPYAGLAVDTVYFGGGTPTLPGADWLNRVLEAFSGVFSFQADSEITLEANPETVDPELLKSVRQAGFNRISFGLQTTEAEALVRLGRRHSVQQGKQAILWAAQAGFDNISADLMLGLPGQDNHTALQSICSATELPLQHISAYLLKIEPGTLFGQRKETLDLPGEDALADLYENAVFLLEEAGFYQYEISNFARPGTASRHNLKYWRLQEYLGLGPTAHSFWKGRRFYYPRSLSEFLADPCHVTDDGPGGTKEEYIAMSFRLTEGMNLDLYRDRYGGAKRENITQLARLWQKAGLCKVDANRIILTAKGFLVSNSIITEILRFEEQ